MLTTLDIIQMIKADNLMKFYKSRDWLSLRQEALIRDNYECQICKENGKYKKAENVHHVNEVKKFPELAMSLNNLQCLCIKCHNDVHDRLDDSCKPKPKFMNEERW